MIAARGLARRASLLAGAVVVFAPILRDIVPAGRLGAGLSTAQFLAFELGLGLFAVFAHRASTVAAPRKGVAFAGLAFGSAVCGLWTSVFLGTDRAVFLPLAPDIVGVACFILVAVLLAGTIAGGRHIAFLAAAAVVLGYAGQFPGAGGGAAIPFASYVNYLVYGADGLLGRALDIMVDPVLAFVLFGAVFEASGGGRAIARLALRIAAQSRSGAIKACILASGLFGAISGTAISNVMTTGAFSIPAMRRIGVRNATAAGIEAAASTGGQVMPPVMGAAAFILADFAGVSYATVALASLLPALGVYFAMFRQADLVAFAPDAEPVPADPPRLGWSLLLYVLPPGVLVLVLIGSDVQAVRAALAGSLCGLTVSLVLAGGRETLLQLRRGFEKLVRTGVQLIIIAATMGLLLGVLNATGIAVAATVGLSDLGQDSQVLALLVAGAAAFVLGIGMATVGVYILAAAMLAPGLIAAGVPPLGAHLFVLYCGLLSMLTPPVALASLAASSLAKADFGATAWAALRFGWVLFVMPFIIVAQPGLILLGGWGDVAQAIVVTGVFMWSVTHRALPAGVRAGIAAIAGLAIVWPGPDWAALGLSLAVAVVLLGRSRSARP